MDCDGWFDDGSTSGTPRVNVELANEMLVQQIGQLALRLGIVGTYRYKSNDRAGVWIWSSPMVDVWQGRVGSTDKSEKLAHAVQIKTQLSHEAKSDWNAWRQARPSGTQTFADCPEGYEWRRVIAIRTSVASTVSIKVHNDNHAFVGYAVEHNTNTVAVLAEELLPHVPMTICDIEGEYYGLKERFDLLVAGRSDQAEVPLFRENAASLAEVSIQRGISIILDLSEIELEEMQEILLTYFERLWQLASSLKSPYEIVIEEAHEYIPQGTRTPLKSLLTRFALRGRKRGIGVILASQRSSKVEKDLLTQANIGVCPWLEQKVGIGT